MSMTELNHLDIIRTFSSSKCLLVSFHANNNHSLSRLIQFGWTAVQHKRLALLLTMGAGVTLKSVRNTTRMPFLVASEVEDGKRQFLCPVVGEHEPRLQNYICHHSYASYKNKTIRVGMIGMRPWFFGNWLLYLLCYYALNTFLLYSAQWQGRWLRSQITSNDVREAWFSLSNKTCF